jgi:hypothetical protein
MFDVCLLAWRPTRRSSSENVTRDWASFRTIECGTCLKQHFLNPRSSCRTCIQVVFGISGFRHMRLYAIKGASLIIARRAPQRSLRGGLPDRVSSSRVILPLTNRLGHFFTTERESASCLYTPSNSAVISVTDSFLRVNNRTTTRCSVTNEEFQTIF